MTGAGEASSWHLRLAMASDVARLHAINEAASPGVGAVSLQRFQQLVAMARFTIAAIRENELGGFIMVMADGSAYDGDNFAWIAARYPSFAYVDRIAIASAHRGEGLGARLYVEVISRLAGSKPVLTCEVNTLPPNPGSMRFHERLGFKHVGARTSIAGEKAVAYLALELGR